MAVDARLAKKGQREPRVELAQQLRVSGGHWEVHKDALAAAGFDLAEGPKLLEYAVKLESDTAKQAEAKAGSLDKTKAEGAAMDGAKVFVRKVRNIIRPALRKRPVAGVSSDSFASGGPLERSTPKMSAYLNQIIRPLEAAEGSLKPYFGGAKPADLARDIKDKLDKADTTQEIALASLPLDTQQVYETKGRAVELIEELNAVAKNAFDGNAQVVALFNKDLLLRGRKARKTVDPVPPA